MTKKHFEAAAEQVRNILAGHWTMELPPWGLSADCPFDPHIETSTELAGNVRPSYVCAVWTAESYVILFSSFNPRFDRNRFIKACGFTGDN